MAYQLAVLRDTQMVQRRQLEAWYPYIDWSKMPFSSYGDFFRLRSIMEECGEVWTNAYGRSNEEDSSTRKYLKDYSGNGRDIELFNFGYSKQSGYNGYVQDFRSFENLNGTEAVITEGSIKATNTLASGTWILAFYGMTKYVNKEWRVMAEIEEGASASLVFYVSSTNTQTASVPFHNGLNVIPVQDYGEATSVAISLSRGKSLTLTQVPDYRGAIVGDGVDDYGQCIKGFALPDDYTVVAMREYISFIYAPLAYKAAFTLELGNVVCQSYSAITTLDSSKKPLLFSYQAKFSYNGNDINVGSSGDSDATKLMLFKRQSDAACANTALYSFGIFNRTLTADELRIVENCMYAEWIAMTGKLEDIEYYDILDARFRSNDEDADKRNRWVGRLGKLHMTLNNYAYSQMSGWNGWPLPRQCTFSVAKQGSSYWLSYMGAPAAVKTNSWGIRIVSNPTGDPISLIYISSSNTVVKTIALNEGTVNIIPPMTEDFANLAFSLPNHPVGSVVEFEQIPLYGGALVSDGVDDYAVSDEVIDEEIGGVVAHAELLGGTYLFAYNLVQNSIWGYKYNEFLRIADAAIDDNQVTATNVQSDRGVFAYSRTPALTTGDLFIARTANSSNPEPGQNALYQLRLIKTQPTDVQLEAIKWQCRKEHDDYLIHMGWKEVE